MLLRRPTLSALQHAYRFVSVAGRRRFTLWPCVRRELWTLLGLLPLLHANLAAPFWRHAVATDASELGAGVVCTPLDARLHRRLWPLCSTRSLVCTQTLLHSVQARGDDVQQWAAALGMPPAQCEAMPACARAFHGVYRSVSARRWSPLISSAWRRAEHINALELRAVLLALHWALSYPSSHSSRVYLLVDSTVALFALWKGRSSSHELLRVLRRCAALLLASGAVLLTGWLPSAVNPADKPSRLMPPADAM